MADEEKSQEKVEEQPLDPFFMWRQFTAVQEYLKTFNK